MEKRKNILRKVKGYIDTELNPSKTNLCYPARDDFEEENSIEDIFISLQISESEYEAALFISDDNGFHVHLKRPLNSCFVNNYFSEGILAWEANLDIQPIFSHHKVAVYMCAYLLKLEDECTQGMS